MLCFLVDYKDEKGNDFYKPLQVATFDKELAMAFIHQEVADWNCTLTGVRLFHGFHTHDELYQLAETITLPPHELLYFNPYA